MSKPNGSRKAAYRTSGNVSSLVEWFGAVLGYCAHENAPRNESEQPAAIFVGYSVISFIQSTYPSVLSGPLNALSFEL